jgi:hypothetical protein
MRYSITTAGAANANSGANPGDPNRVIPVAMDLEINPLNTRQVVVTTRTEMVEGMVLMVPTLIWVDNAETVTADIVADFNRFFSSGRVTVAERRTAAVSASISARVAVGGVEYYPNARNSFAFDLTLTEGRPGSINGNGGIIRLTIPEGFRWHSSMSGNSASVAHDIVNPTIGGIGTNMAGTSLTVSHWMLADNNGVELEAVEGGGGVGAIAIISNGGRTLTFALRFDSHAMTTVPGWLRIHGFRFDALPFNDTYWGDIPIQVDGRNFNLTHPGDNTNVGRPGAFHNSQFEFFSHERVDWELFYRTTSDVPTLVTGRNPSFLRIDGIDNRSDNMFRVPDNPDGIIRNHASRWNMGTTDFWGNT